MRISILLIFETYIICNILVFALKVKGNETDNEVAAASFAATDRDADNDTDKHPLKFNTRLDKPPRPPPPLSNIILPNYLTATPTTTSTTTTTTPSSPSLNAANTAGAAAVADTATVSAPVFATTLSSLSSSLSSSSPPPTSSSSSLSSSSSSSSPSSLSSSNPSSSSSLVTNISATQYSTTPNNTTTKQHTTTPMIDITKTNRFSLRRPEKICPGVHIRNDLKSFEQLRGCTIIDGPLTVALVSNSTHPFESKDYENITFPDLHEITEYLLFFRVQGLSSLNGLFPNLSVIRGNELVSNYALIIYEMMDLHKINLPRLSDILRGSVRIEFNPNLCYVSTVNWESICKHAFTAHFIKDNNQHCNNFCPENCRPWTSKSNSETTKIEGDVDKLGSKTNRSLFCWTGQQCQEFCQTDDGLSLPLSPNGGCCSHQCAGGCYIENRSDQCFSCRSVSQGTKCVERCDPSLYQYKSRCINETECTQMVEFVQQNQCALGSDSQFSTTNLKPIRLSSDKHGTCQVSCPPDFEEDPTNKNRCKPCDKGKCRKVCTPQGSDKPFMVTNVNSLRELSGCNAINGSLEIIMKGGKNVLRELEMAFQDLEEIKGYLKITRSYPILTLGFLNGLKAINGSELERGQYSLIIIDNPNLQELFTFNKSENNQKKLTILMGKIFVHLNPKLCPHRIENLKSYASVADWDDRDVSIHTNGDKEACDTQKLQVEFSHGTSRAALIRFQNFAAQMDDPRSLLYYLINYREVPNGTVTMFDGRDGCNSQTDVWVTIEVPPVQSRGSSADEHQEAIITVKPSTRYALYVKTFTIFAGSTGALSDIIYFETAPDTPGIPRQIEATAKDHESVVVSWSPPSKPNGIIERYIVTITKIPEMEDFQTLDICDSIVNRDMITRTHTETEPKKSALADQAQANMTNNSSDTSSSSSGPGTSGWPPSNTCAKTTTGTDTDIQVEVVEFQDMIIDIVYLKQACPSNYSRFVRKRSTDYIESESYNSDTSPIETKYLPMTPMTHTSSKPEITKSSNEISTQPNIKFDRSREKTELNVMAKGAKSNLRSSYTISNLDHFSLYTIEVRACHGDFVSNHSKTSKTYSKCSIQAIAQVRTLPIEEYNKILPETVIFYPTNESTSENLITWKKPERPNGLVFAYRIRYRPKNGAPEFWTEGCINNSTYTRDGGFILSNISPGTYLFSVQAITMLETKQQLWSDPPLEFEIPQDYFVSTGALTVIIVLGLILLALGVASGTYYYQKKRHELNNGLIYASVNPDYMQYDPDEWEVDKSNLIIGIQIGTGSFGMVYKGQLHTEKGNLSCAIKTVPSTSTAKQRIDFLREASIMKQFDTYHVVKLMGVISTTTPVYVIMEFMENGDLKSFLRSLREVHQREKKTLVDGIYLMAAQIADGMAYLASKKFVHRDLAARNCMVGEDRVVKIGDFGLTRDIYVNDYYRRDTHSRLPVRWMAPESLKDNLYTSASDVWSYGIVLWEIVTFSAYPYQGQSNDEVIKRVVHGFTMPRPENCPDKLHQIMERCWRKNDRDRPTFIDIVEYLLPETEGKFYPNCFYRKQITEGDSIAQPASEENTVGAESYPLLPYPPNRANGLTNGVNHVNQSKIDEMKMPLP